MYTLLYTRLVVLWFSPHLVCSLEMHMWRTCHARHADATNTSHLIVVSARLCSFLALAGVHCVACSRPPGCNWQADLSFDSRRQWTTQPITCIFPLFFSFSGDALRCSGTMETSLEGRQPTPCRSVQSIMPLACFDGVFRMPFDRSHRRPSFQAFLRLYALASLVVFAPSWFGSDRTARRCRSCSRCVDVLRMCHWPPS